MWAKLESANAFRRPHDRVRFPYSRGLHTGGSLTTNFVDLPPQIILSGAGVVTTNRLDIGAATNTPARYYRVRLVR